jgi:hypothetical protein
MVNTRKGGGIDLPANPYNRRVLRQQQQAEMNPPNPPPVGVDPVISAQMQIMQQMADTMADMHAHMRQERQEMRQEREDIRREMHQERNSNSNRRQCLLLHHHHQFHPRISTGNS